MLSQWSSTRVTQLLIVFSVLLLIACLLITAMLWLGWRNVDVASTPRADAIEQRRELARAALGMVPESADWFGKTGLGEQTERELPRYLRREFGEERGDAWALHANELRYLGMFNQGGVPTYFWRIQSLRFHDDVVYAYVTVNGDNVGMGWGDRYPPGALKP